MALIKIGIDGGRLERRAYTKASQHSLEDFRVLFAALFKAYTTAPFKNQLEASYLTITGHSGGIRQRIYNAAGTRFTRN